MNHKKQVKHETELPAGSKGKIAYFGYKPDTKIPMDKLDYPFSVEDLEKYNIFFVTNKSSIVSDLYYTLAQHSKKEKMIVSNDTYMQDYGHGTSAGYLPIPFKFFLDIPREIPLGKFRGIDLVPYSSLTYAELLILFYYHQDNKGDFNIDDYLEVVYSWLKEKIGRVALNIENPKKMTGKHITTKEEYGSTTYSEKIEAAGILTVSIRKDILNNLDYSQSWILMDPNQSIDDVPIVSLFKMSEEDMEVVFMRQKLERSVKEPRTKNTRRELLYNYTSFDI